MQLLVGAATDINRIALRRALAQEHPLIVIPTNAPQRHVNVFSPLGLGPNNVSVHPDAHLLSLSVAFGGTIAIGRRPTANSTSSLVVRWMNTADYGPPIPVPLTELVQALTGVAARHVVCKEHTLSMLDTRQAAEARRLNWGGVAGDDVMDQDLGPSIAWAETEVGGCGSVLVDPMDIRTFELTW